MDRATAAKVESVMRTISAQINETIRLVMDECEQDEFESYRKVAGQLMGEIFCDVLSPIYEAHPDLTPAEPKK